MSDLDFDMDFDFDFDMEGTAGNNSGLLSARYIAPKKTRSISEWNIKYEYAETLAKDIGPLDESARVFVLINGQFIFGDFIEAWIIAQNLNVLDLTISTLSMSKDNVDSLANLLHGDYVQDLHLLVSDYFFQHERYPDGLIPYLYRELDVDNRLQVSVAGVHTKICLIRTECGQKIVIHGSANMRSSDNLEQFVIERSDDLYDFNKEWHDAIEADYYSVDKRKPKRGKNLWPVVAAEKNPNPTQKRKRQPKNEEERNGRPDKPEIARKQKAW